MGSKTLLGNIKQTAAELQLGFTPTEILSSQDKSVIQSKALLVACCDELAETFNWQGLLKEATITTVPGQSLYDLPTDCLRIVSDTAWDRSAMLPLTGDVPPPAFQELQSGYATVGPYTRIRLIGNKVQLLPTPGDTSTLAYNYITNNYVIDANLGTLVPEFTHDSDKVVFPDRLVINFLKLKLMQVKSMDTTAAVQDYNSSLLAAQAADVPTPTLSMAGCNSDYLLSDMNFSRTAGGV